MIFVEAVGAILSIVILSLAIVMQPIRARCPGDMYLIEGVRESGAFICAAVPPRNCGEPVPPTWRCPEAQMKIYSKISCTSGFRPIVVDYNIVGCQR